MKIVFITDIFNHHQSDMADFFFTKAGLDFYYIVTKKISTERIKLGWSASGFPSYVLNYWENKQKCDQTIMDSDIVIYGSVAYSLVKKRVNSKRITFCYSERPFKNIKCLLQYPLRMIKYLLEGGRKTNQFFLAASAYAPFDYTRCFCFKNRYYKWGYFPKVRKYENLEAILDAKKRFSMVWVGRFIKWKHPEYAVDILEQLHNLGYEEFNLKMIGVGPEKARIQHIIKEKKLDNSVIISGPMPPEEVRREMELSQFFLFTSDFNEGWGAVINEAMNSCCIPIASHSGGAVPYLIKSGENGVIYKLGNIQEASTEIIRIANDKHLINNLSTNAYYSIVNEWNGQNAAERLMVLYKDLKNYNECESFSDGPCSKASLLKNNWYR